MLRRLLFLLLLCAVVPVAPAADVLLPRPAELEPDVQFWIRVYSEISTNEGFIHDQRNLAIVYETLRFGDASPAERKRLVDGARERYQAALRHLATGAAAKTPEELRVRQLWGAGTAPARLTSAIDDVRFQLGQSDRFLAGLKRSGAWETHIAETLANRGLPPELAALPHVESSFDPGAYSKVGASGLWQFMRSTGRLFLRIDQAVDERLDPFRSTEAAAQLLAYNYRVLGSWPLAITAYNHGAGGMRRAKEQVGSDDIVRLVREYRSRSFGFASRNFYVCFLAALAIDQDPQKYFGPLTRVPDIRFHEVALPAASSMGALERVLGVDRKTLRGLNPALLPIVWRGDRQVPRGYRLRLPESTAAWTSEMLAQRLGAQPAEPMLAAVAPPAATRAAQAVAETQKETRAVQSAGRESARSEPVSAAQAVEQGPTLVPGATTASAVDIFDYSVAADGSIRVAAAETLGHHADWLGLSATRLRQLNGLRYRSTVAIGQRLRLEFRRVSREQFEQRRRDYHEKLQAEYFATHRITGTEIYIARRGDSLWSLTKRAAPIPVWLLQQFNPDVNFSELKPGVQLIMPRIEAVSDV